MSVPAALDTVKSRKGRGGGAWVLLWIMVLAQRGGKKGEGNSIGGEARRILGHGDLWFLS